VPEQVVAVHGVPGAPAGPGAGEVARCFQVGDGEAALRFLRRNGDFAGMPRPALVVLDLNLPRRSGLEVLGELKADHDLHTIPVVVLTTSQAEGDIARSYQLHANAYVIKPFDADQFTDAIRQIHNFFLTLVKRPQ
jgi:CheY-like chemotaxis protein